MARKPIINPEELMLDMPCRIQLTAWDKYQEQLGSEDTRQFVKLMVFRPMDSIIRGTPNERLIWWELLRLSGAGRRKGWVVLGDNEPITVRDIAMTLRIDEAVVLDGMRHNMKERRITCNEA